MFSKLSSAAILAASVFAMTQSAAASGAVEARLACQAQMQSSCQAASSYPDACTVAGFDACGAVNSQADLDALLQNGRLVLVRGSNGAEPRYRFEMAGMGPQSSGSSADDNDDRPVAERPSFTPPDGFGRGFDLLDPSDFGIRP